MKISLVKYILISLSFLAFSATVSAQELTNVETRKVNAMILDVIDRYEDFAGVYDEETEYEFLRLFQSPDAPVYAGDLLLGYRHDETLPASEYAVKMLDFTPNLSIRVSKVRKGQAYFDSGLLYVPITLKKSVEYTDGNLIISSDIFYDKLFDLTLLLACDLERERCKICSIEGSVDSDKVFPMNFVVVRRPASSTGKVNLESILTDNGKPLEYNSLDYAIVSEDGLDSPEVQEMKYEVRMTQNIVDSTFRHKEIEFGFKKTRGRFKIRNKVAPTSAYEISNAPLGISSKSWAYELGFDLGFGVPMGKTGASRFGLFVGAAVNYSALTLMSDPFSYEYTLSSTQSNHTGNDIALHKTKYAFNINSVLEAEKFIDVMVPLYMSFDHRLDRKGRVWLNWNVGIKSYLNLNSFLGITNSSYTLDGTLTVTNSANQQIHNNDFMGSYNGFLIPKDTPKSLIEISATANAGVNVRISRSAFLTVGAGYEIGLTNSHIASKDTYYDRVSVFPFVCDNSFSTIAINSMFNTVDYRRKALWLDLGFMFKF